MGYSVQQLYRNSVVLLCVALVILLTGSMTLVSFIETRHAYTRELTTQARMIAMQLVEEKIITPSVIKQRLNAAVASQSLALACVYNGEGRPLSEIHGPAYRGVDCDHLAEFDIGVGYILGRAPIVAANLPKATGEVAILAQTPLMHWYMGLWLLVAALLGLLLALVCWLLGLRLQKTVLDPIRQIATTAQRVSLYKDYSLRVVAGALSVVPSEIESLTDSFNAMLKEIEDRDSRLTRKTVELEKAKQNAEAASVAKSQFLANVSHELRTPLNAIIGFSTMLGDEQFGPLGSPKYVEYSKDILDSGKHLLDVINDILDLSKAEAGKLSVTFETLALPRIIEKALNIVAGQAHERKIDIYTQMPEKMPKIIADRVRLVQILLNLLSNAIKFTNAGGKIIVRAAAEEGKNGVHYFTIEVEDNGIGMDETSIRKAFSTFNQADAGLNRKYEGAGLGLPLTKRLVELHHGKIKIESTPGRGTTVIVRLTSNPALLD